VAHNVLVFLLLAFSSNVFFCVLHVDPFFRDTLLVLFPYTLFVLYGLCFIRTCCELCFCFIRTVSKAIINDENTRIILQAFHLHYKINHKILQDRLSIFTEG
jgi:hypothetical protein